MHLCYKTPIDLPNSWRLSRMKQSYFALTLHRYHVHTRIRDVVGNGMSQIKLMSVGFRRFQGHYRNIGLVERIPSGRGKSWPACASGRTHLIAERGALSLC